MEFKFKVRIVEFERGWGSKVDEVRNFDTYEEAEKFIKDFNVQNIEPSVPDWYMIAEPHNFTLNNN